MNNSENSGFDSLDDIASDLSEIHSSDADSQFSPKVVSEYKDKISKGDVHELKTPLVRLRDREKFLLRLDRLLISGGAHFVLFLPILVLVNFGLAQSYNNTTPSWWLDHVQDVAPVEMAMGIHLISLFILVTDILLLLILLRLLTVTKHIFHLEAESLTRAGLTFRSSHGYAEMRATINGSSRRLSATIGFLVLSAMILATALWISVDGEISTTLLAFSTSAVLAGQGVYLVSDQTRFNANEPWGMLDAFSPPIHPALLKRPFSDVIKAHVDPLLAVRISEYLRTVESRVKDEYSITQMQEMLLHLLHLRRRSVIEDSEFISELTKMIDENSLQRLFDHPELGEETWERLLDQTRSDCAPFFRLYDRLHMRYESGRRGDIWFDVDMENLVLGQANLFAFVLNQGDEDRNLILRVQTPDFRPNECVYNLQIKPNIPIEMQNQLSPPLTTALPNIVSSTQMIWQSLLPSAEGEATVTVRLEDDVGNLVAGRVLTVQIRSDLFTRIRLSTGALFITGSAIAFLSPILPFVGSLLGL